MESNRYSRQEMLPDIGPDGQRHIKESSVLIVGLGGLGAPVAAYLAGAGVGRIGLADNDVVSLSNLHRQILYTERQVGVPKVEAARERLSEISSGTRYDMWKEGLTPDNARVIIEKYDLVVDCTDNFATRFLIDEECEMARKPWIHGSVEEYYGQVAVFTCDSTHRYRDIYSDWERLRLQPGEPKGITGPVAGVVGSFQALEVLKLIVGQKSQVKDRLYTMDFIRMEIENIDF